MTVPPAARAVTMELPVHWSVVVLVLLCLLLGLLAGAWLTTDTLRDELDRKVAQLGGTVLPDELAALADAEWVRVNWEAHSHYDPADDADVVSVDLTFVRTHRDAVEQ